jgi:hypothetical protein
MRLLSLLTLGLFLHSAIRAEDWPQWRGPNRDGKSATTGINKDWTAKSPALLWQQSGFGEDSPRCHWPAIAFTRLATATARSA